MMYFRPLGDRLLLSYTSVDLLSNFPCCDESHEIKRRRRREAKTSRPIHRFFSSVDLPQGERSQPIA